MRFEVKLRVVADDGAVIEDCEILALDKANDRIEAIGLSLGEAKSLLGRLLHTLVGYTANPSGAQVVAYLLTLTVIIVLMRTVQGRQALARKGLQKA